MTHPTPVLLSALSLGIGGCERDLARLALRLDRRKFLPHVACMRPGGIREEELHAAGVPIAYFPFSSFASPKALLPAAWKLAAYCRRHGIRLLQGFDVPASMFAVPVGRCIGVQSIASQLSYRTAYSRHFQAALTAVHSVAHAVVVNSEATRLHLVHDAGVSPKKLYLCYNGVDPADIYPPASDQREPLPDAHLPGRRPLIGVVSALREEKQLHILLEAFARVSPQHPTAALVFVGGGELLPQLTARAAELGIQNAVHFEPTRSDVERWLRALDIFVLPSRSESFSNAVLEALGCGCAVIASAVGGLPEMVRPEKTGLLFPSGNVSALAAALERLITSPDLRHQLGAAAAQMVADEFPITRTVERMEALYTSLLQGHGVPA